MEIKNKLPEMEKQLPEHLQILELKDCVFTYDEVTKRGLQNAFQLYCRQRLIVEYSKVIRQRVKVRGVGIAKFKQKYNVPKGTALYTFVRDHETKEYKELERLWVKRIAWIQMVDRVNCDRVDRVVEDSQRATERHKTKSIDKQIVEEVEWLKGAKVQPRTKGPFICKECGGTTYRVNKGQQACTSCGVGFNTQSAGPGPRVIKRPKRKFKRVEYINGDVKVLSKEGQLTNGVMEVYGHEGWMSGKGVM